jgi:hypothetical protein
MIKRVALATAFAASMVAATNVQAACNSSYNIVERVLTYSSGTTYVYFRNSWGLLSSYYDYCLIPNNLAGGDRLAALAASAKANRVEINVQGSASSCPTTGTGRYIGVCNYFYLLN